MSENGDPPRDTRFKPGQSGNPKGRPKGAKSFRTNMQTRLRSLVTITENGRKKKITVAEALARLLIRRAFEGDMKAIAMLAAFQEKHDPVEQSNTPVGENDIAIIAAYLAREGKTK